MPFRVFQYPLPTDGEQKAPSTDGACSRSAAAAAADEAPRKSPPDVDIRTEHGGENTPGGAAPGGAR